MKYSAIVFQIQEKVALIKSILEKEAPTPEEVDEAKSLDLEVKELEQKAKELKDSINTEVNDSLTIPTGVHTSMEEKKTFGDLFVNSESYKAYTKGTKNIDCTVQGVDFKTTMETSAGWAPFVPRDSRVAFYPTETLNLFDIIPTIPVTLGGAYKYMKETTFTNSAAAQAETSGTYGESAIALTETTSTLRKIGTLLPVTEEQLADVPGMVQYLNNRLSTMVLAKAQWELIHGTGSAPHCDGLLDDSQGITKAAVGSDNIFDAIAKAAKSVRTVGMVEPDTVLVTPKVYADLLTTKASTAGSYLLGGPNAPSNNLYVWGMKVVVCPSYSPATSGVCSVVVGAFNQWAAIPMVPEISFAITDSHSTNFAYGLLAVRANVRLNLAVYRASAFCGVYNIALS